MQTFNETFEALLVAREMDNDVSNCLGMGEKL
jgi:hypothetical protein